MFFPFELYKQCYLHMVLFTCIQDELLTLRRNVFLNGEISVYLYWVHSKVMKYISLPRPC